jgi:hypothetical protein
MDVSKIKKKKKNWAVISVLGRQRQAISEFKG